MWCQPRVPKASRVSGSRGCYPALGQIPGESFCLGMLSPCLAPVCRGIYFRVKKRETNKGALKIIEVGEGGSFFLSKSEKPTREGLQASGSRPVAARCAPGSKPRARGGVAAGVPGPCCPGRWGRAGAPISRSPAPPSGEAGPAARGAPRRGEGVPAAPVPPCRPEALWLPEPPPPRGQPARGFVKKPLPLHPYIYIRMDLGMDLGPFIIFFWCSPPSLL